MIQSWYVDEDTGKLVVRVKALKTTDPGADFGLDLEVTAEDGTKSRHRISPDRTEISVEDSTGVRSLSTHTSNFIEFQTGDSSNQKNSRLILQNNLVQIEVEDVTGSNPVSYTRTIRPTGETVDQVP